MPFGLFNALAILQRLMQNCLGELNMTNCLIYLDDVIVFLKTDEEHLHCLWMVFEHLREHHLKLKLTKCEYFKSEIKYQAHHVSKEDIWPSKDNLKAAAEFTPLRTYTKILVCLGLMQPYRWFIKEFAFIAQPLHENLSGEGASKMNKQVMLMKKMLVPLRCLRRLVLRPLYWHLLISISHFSWKLVQAS